MSYRVYIIAVKNKYEMKDIMVYEPLKRGTIIKLGADENEDDGLKKWKVTSCWKLVEEEEQ